MSENDSWIYSSDSRMKNEVEVALGRIRTVNGSVTQTQCTFEKDILFPKIKGRDINIYAFIFGPTLTLYGGVY